MPILLVYLHCSLYHMLAFYGAVMMDSHSTKLQKVGYGSLSLCINADIFFPSWHVKTEVFAKGALNRCLGLFCWNMLHFGV